MRKTVLFIAISLDGYIADEKGNVNWLEGHSAKEETLDTYSVFIKNIDSVIMGWNTYHQIVTELSPEKWIYSDLTTYVITHRDLPSANKIRFTEKNPCKLVEELKQKQGKNIWICGGADIVQQLIAANAIDKYYISVIPIILGNGIQLFGKSSRQIPLKLLSTQTYNGITELIYQRR
ncbi:MAG TPA: dihydrofolate reductase family protein [Candidatus Hungatella pullicola]|nr:dihydrofolate reductase family protein [Candidatus Hungatella pullicola]